ncbi:MAG: hypothetical protein ACLGGX_08340 [Bdellovibrionia bacterium]
MKWNIKKLAILSSLALALFIVLTRLLLTPVDDLTHRHFTRGDAFSDINTYSAVQYFYEHGLWESKLRPVHRYDPQNGSPHLRVYTHYPALPDVAVGIWSKLIDSTDIRWVRVFPFLLSLGWLFLMWKFLGTFLGDTPQRWVGFCLLVVSGYFIPWADSIHKHPWEEFSKWLFTLLLFYYYTKGRSFWILGLLGVVAFFTSHTSFEPIVYIAVLVVGFSMVFEKSWWKGFLSRESWFLGFCFVLGFVSHIYLNALYFGSWQLALNDLHEALAHRTANCPDPALCGMSFLDHLQIPLVANSRIERYFIIPGIAMFYFCWLAYKKLKTIDTTKAQLFLVFLAASFSWYFFMKQHAWVHHFVGKQSGLAFGIAMGVGGLQYLQNLKERWKGLSLSLKSLQVLFITYIVAMALTQQVIEIWWKHGLALWLN